MAAGYSLSVAPSLLHAACPHPWTGYASPASCVDTAYGQYTLFVVPFWDHRGSQDSTRAASILLAILLDRSFGEPPASLHPVVWIGRTVDAVDRRLPEYAHSVRAFTAGGALTALTLACAALPSWLLDRCVARGPGALRFVLLAAALKPAFAWRALDEHVERVAASLRANDLPAARKSLSMIVSRDTTTLDAPRIAAAAIESVAENLSDSLLAPLFWYCVGGLPAVWLYRAVNTLDAMIGYRSPRYEYRGKLAARLDDALNWLPSRLTAAAIAALAPVVDGVSHRALIVALRDGKTTASPNAGWPMAAVAGALGVELEKVDHYRLGKGMPLPDDRSVTAAIRLCRAAGTVSIVALVVLKLAEARAAAPAARGGAPRGRR